MARNTLVWNGLSEYRDAIAKLPADCRDDAAPIVDDEVHQAYTTISAVYGAHRLTGTLQKRFTISPLDETAYTTGRKLTSASPIAWLFDNGSQTRNWKTRSHKSTGAMGSKSPPTHIFARTVGQAKRAIVQRLKDMVLRRGATSVTET